MCTDAIRVQVHTLRNACFDFKKIGSAIEKVASCATMQKLLSIENASGHLTSQKAFTNAFEVTIYRLLVLPWVREIHIYKCMCIDAYWVQDIET